jgi:hypothetical protein
MQTAHVATDDTPWERYGYGIFVTEFQDRADPDQSVTVYEHGGNTLGFGSQLFWVPERGVAVSILDNSPTSLGNAARCALRELAGVVPRPTSGMTTAPGTWDAFAGTYAEMNQALWDATVRITRDGDYLLMHRLEAGTVEPLLNVFGSTFKLDADRNGQPDPGTAGRGYTFSTDGSDGERIRWLRNRVQVMERVGQFPASIAIEGSSCTPLAFTPEKDMPRLALRASGLVAPGTTVAEGTVSQDDPADPSTASFKQHVTVAGEAGLFTVRIVPQPGDTLALYLLGDDDGDGRHSYPGELIDVGWEGQGYRLLTATGRLPAGRYAIWVHGVSVRGANRPFTLETRLVDGENLRIEGAPDAVEADRRYEVAVCARGVAGLDRPMTGLVELDYGSPPRRVRIPVDWAPAATHSAYIPLASRGD